MNIYSWGHADSRRNYRGNGIISATNHCQHQQQLRQQQWRLQHIVLRIRSSVLASIDLTGAWRSDAVISAVTKRQPYAAVAHIIWLSFHRCQNNSIWTSCTTEVYTGIVWTVADLRCEIWAIQTRSQAVARIADRTASQHLWGSRDVIGHVTIR